MSEVLLGVIPLATLGLVFGGVVLWERFREPRRDPRRIMAVVDRRTYRNACRRVDKLVRQGDWTRAHAHAVAICQWLNYEQHHGRRLRRERLAADLEVWTARRQEYSPAVS